MIELDHVLYAVVDLDDAAARFERDHGLRSYVGGEHPAFGTANRIVPLGDVYIELIGVTDPEVAAANPVGQTVAARVADGDAWLGWVVRTGDLDALAARHGLLVLPGSRTRPDGSVISWRAAGMEKLLEDPRLPFFIAWDDPADLPGRTDANDARVATLRVGIGADELAAWIGGGIPEVEPATGAGVVDLRVARGDGSSILIG